MFSMIHIELAGFSCPERKIIGSKCRSVGLMRPPTQSLRHLFSRSDPFLAAVNKIMLDLPETIPVRGKMLAEDLAWVFGIVATRQ